VDTYVRETKASAAAYDEPGGKATSSSSSSTAPKSAPTAPRIVVNLSHLRSMNPALVRAMMVNPMAYIVALEDAINDMATEENSKFVRSECEIKVGFEGSFGSYHVSPRGLLSSNLRSLVCVEGIVTKCSTVRPKIMKSVHYCEATGNRESKEYRDATALTLGLKNVDENGNDRGYKMPTNSQYPTKDKENNPMETEFGLCTYSDSQTITIQEMPERAPMGQLPRSVDLVLDADLVDKVKPGDRIQAMGVYRALAGAASTVTSGVFRTVVLTNNLKIIGADTGAGSLQLEAEDVGQIKAVAKRDDVLEVLGRSVAPSIFGHSYMKKALALQLLGGMEKNLENGTHLRGDINVLMVGDPSTAKSQMLRAALQIAPLAISTTGRGSSGVGLTAAVTQDTETGDRRLEAGAMVLADRGMVCIDEFDKMSEQDRVAIHEVMEQQTVTIAKAGIHASLNARCSVIAAANPVYGQYDKSRRPQDNIGLPDSLLSRFDLLFIVLDQLDPENDRRISAHVLRGHRYRKPGTDMAPEPLQAPAAESDDEDERDKRTVVWQRSHHSSTKTSNKSGDDDHADDVLSQDFLRKYIFYAKKKIQPELTEEAREYIANRYAEMRSKQDDKTLPVTARSLETIIRLSSAHAKARLSQEVEVKDCEGAMDIMSYALYHEEDKSKLNKRKLEEVPEQDDEENEMTDENVPPVVHQVKKKATPEKEVVVDEFEAFRGALNKMFAAAISATGDAELQISQIVEETGVDSEKAGDFLERLSKANVIMVDDDSVMQI
jgi:DNA replication licensing factor MCM3